MAATQEIMFKHIITYTVDMTPELLAEISALTADNEPVKIVKLLMLTYPGMQLAEANSLRKVLRGDGFKFENAVHRSA